MSRVFTRTVHARQESRTRLGLGQRQTSLGSHVCIQRHAHGAGVQPQATALVRDVLNAPGQPLDADTRSAMERRFRHDFSGVRVHADRTAADSAQALNAGAYTVGTHVAFGAGRYAPSGSSGRELIAHELAHVVQQSTGNVDGTSIGGGFYVSHPNDPFERRASAHDVRSSGKAAPISARGETHIQRDSLGLSTGAADTGNAANQASALSAWSALGSAVAGLGSMVAAFEGLKFARRQAEAAEDPPVAEPTTGGVTSTHIELPEVKGIDPDDLAPHDETTAEEEEETVISGLKGNEPIPEKEKTGLSKELKTRKFKTKKVHKPADKADQEKSFTVLRLQQGADNQADFILTLRFNGKDVRGGATEDGEIRGYLGGSAESNAAVTFRGSPGAPQMNNKDASKNGAATVRLLFGGTNVPPRKEHSGSLGLFGGSAKKEDYKVQRFSAAAKFSGDGEFKGFDTLVATPRERSVVQRGANDKEPLVTIALAESDVDAKKRLEPINPVGAKQAAPPPPQKP